MIRLTCYKLTEDVEADAVLIGSYAMSVQGLLDAVKVAQAIKQPETRLGAELSMFGESMLVTQLLGSKTTPTDGWPSDPSEPAPMSVPERAAMVLRLAQIGELRNFLRNEAAYNNEQALIRGSLYYQGFMGDPMNVAPGFQGDAQFWYDYGKKMGAEFESPLAA
jgi:hypothetical protein